MDALPQQTRNLKGKRCCRKRLQWRSGCRLAIVCVIPLLLIEEQCRTIADCWETQISPFPIYLLFLLPHCRSNNILFRRWFWKMSSGYWRLARCSAERRVLPQSNRLLTLLHDGCAAVLVVTQMLDLGSNCGAAGEWLRSRAKMLMWCCCRLNHRRHWFGSGGDSCKTPWQPDAQADEYTRRHNRALTAFSHCMKLKQTHFLPLVLLPGVQIFTVLLQKELKAPQPKQI